MDTPAVSAHVRTGTFDVPASHSVGSGRLRGRQKVNKQSLNASREAAAEDRALAVAIRQRSAQRRSALGSSRAQSLKGSGCVTPPLLEDHSEGSMEFRCGR